MQYYKVQSNTCIMKSPFGTKKKWPYKTGDLLKEVKFIRHFLWQDKKKMIF